MNILAELRTRFDLALSPFTNTPSSYLGMIQPVHNSRFGDYQANCAMPLAAQITQAPLDIAKGIVSRLDVSDLCLEPEIAGRGFINLRLRDDWLTSQINSLARDHHLGVEMVSSPRTIVVDYSGPNIAKPMHVGHLRSTVIGDALYKILKFKGHKVISDNHLGDWGTQFGMIIYGYKHFIDRDAYSSDPVSELARLYRLVNQLCTFHETEQELPSLYQQLNQKEAAVSIAKVAHSKGNENAHEDVKRIGAEIAELSEKIAECKQKLMVVDKDKSLRELAAAHTEICVETRRETARLHAGDKTNLQLWHEFLPKCIDALNAVYDRMKIRFDMMLGESYFQPYLADIVNDLLVKGIARESEDAVCVFVKDNSAPFIIKKADGAFTYASTDLGTIKYRLDELKADIILYVVDARQSEHFVLLFDTTKRWGYRTPELRHIIFGSVLGKDKKPFRTREGGIIGLESLIDEAIRRARQIVDESDDAKPNGAELSEDERAKVAEAVGLGGIKYADLKHNRESDYIFSWDKMLATTGDSSTYIQYAHARICGIFRKAGLSQDEIRARHSHIAIVQPEERALALQLLRFSEAVDGVCADYRPNILTHFLFELSNAFTGFYNKCSVMKEADVEIQGGRLALCELTARMLHDGLQLIGVDACERM